MPLWGRLNDCGRPCRRSPNSTKRLMSASGIASARLHHRLDTRPFGVRSLTAFWHSTAGTHGSVCRLVKDRHRYAWRRQARARNRAPGSATGADVRVHGFPWPEGGIPNVRSISDPTAVLDGACIALFPIPEFPPRAVLSLPQQRRNR